MVFLVPLLLLVGGFALLAAGGESLVRGATSIARLAGVSAAVVGLTVVAMGTSVPELVVSVVSAIEGHPELAVANVIGSNIFNITATLGLTAVIIALPVHGSAVRLEWPVMFIASAVVVLMLRDGIADRLEAAFLVASLVVFTAYSVHIARREVRGEERREFEAQAELRSHIPGTRDALIATILVVVGCALLVVGGRVFVDGATRLARLAGLTDRVIGLTVVAAGTGMPEIVTSVIAAFRRQTDVAIANLVGSNIFNLLGILGVTALVHPIVLPPGSMASDAWWMLGTALLLFPLLRSGMTLSRREGSLLVGIYVVYIAQLLRGSGG